ncbi:MAG TPA: hypothetical protein VN203_05165, partial [Candidatus Acidoferrum sp.]|nr:hypothetical protein [Candidatus Acidoferrum sp.]
MQTFKRAPGFLLVCLLLVAMTRTAGAQVKLRFAHTIAPEDSQSLAVVEFAKKVAEKTKGVLQIDIFPSGQLGNDPKILEGIKLGTIDMGMTGNPFFSAFAPEMN